MNAVRGERRTGTVPTSQPQRPQPLGLEGLSPEVRAGKGGAEELAQALLTVGGDGAGVAGAEPKAGKGVGAEGGADRCAAGADKVPQEHNS